jgi:DNA-directed RNA polymerase III subunit RPC2
MISKNLDEAKADVKKGIKEAQAHAEAMFGGKGLTDPIPTVEVRRGVVRSMPCYQSRE